MCRPSRPVKYEPLLPPRSTVHKITTLIPAYKTKYMVELMTGLMTQSVKPARVIISDDSPDGEFGRLMRSPALAAAMKRLPIEIHEGPRAGAYENFKQLLRLWGGTTELVHLLLDDDIIYPDFYMRHLMVHASGDYPCSISARWCSNERGQPIEGMPIPKAVWFSSDRALLLDASTLFSTTLPDCQNWLGEFSNCLLKRRAADAVFEPLLAGVSFLGLLDLGTFLYASTLGPVAYIQDRLGAFRTGGEGHSAQINGKHMKAAHLGYAALALGAARAGRLGAEQARQCYAGIQGALESRYAGQAEMQPFTGLLQRMAAGDGAAEQAFVAQWDAFLHHNRL